MPLLGLLLIFQYSVLLGLPPLPWVWGCKGLALDDHCSLVSAAPLSTDTPSVQASREFTSEFCIQNSRQKQALTLLIFITINLMKLS